MTHRLRTLSLALAVALGAPACQKADDAGKAKPGAGTAAGTGSAAGTGPAADVPPHAKMKPPAAQQVTPPLDVKAPPADAEKTPSGLIFKELQAGTGATPGPNDAVKMRFAMWDAEGKTLSSTPEGAPPRSLSLYSAAPGFSEALRKMKVGGKAMFWVPPSLGGPGTPADKGMHAYSVELVEVTAAPATPADVGKPPATAKQGANGVSWTVVKQAAGTVDRPRSWDKVGLAYTGWDATGKIVDTSEMGGKPVDIPMDSLPPVFAEVVPTLGVGERARLWFPAEALAPGRPGAPTGLLTFELEVTKVTKLEKPPEAPSDVAAPPADASKTPRGVFYKVLTKGTGATKPTASDTVSVHYTGWTTDGKRFDSSVARGEPSQFGVSQVIAGWTDALQQMVVGDKWRVWIPVELAYNNQPGRPAGMLVFDVELLGIVPPAGPPPGPLPGKP